MAKNHFKCTSYFVAFLSRRCQNKENVHETFLNTKIPFQKRTFYDHTVQNVPQVSSETLMPRRLVHTKPSDLISREENNSRKRISKRKALLCPQKGIGALF